MNTILLDVEDSVVPFRVTDQDVPLARPDSENVTAYPVANVIDLLTGVPATSTLPEAGLAAYPVAATVNEYVPFGSVNATVEVVDDWGVPASVTDQEVPDGSPVSLKVTA